MQKYDISSSKYDIDWSEIGQENSQQKFHCPSHDHEVVIYTLIGERQFSSLASEWIGELCQNNRNKRRCLGIFESLSGITNRSFADGRDLIDFALRPVKSRESYSPIAAVRGQETQSQVLVDILHKQPVHNGSLFSPILKFIFILVIN